MQTLDTKKIFPVRTYTHTNPFTHKVTTGTTRSGIHDGKHWSDVDIAYYEALHELEERIIQSNIQNEIETLIDDSVEVI